MCSFSSDADLLESVRRARINGDNERGSGVGCFLLESSSSAAGFAIRRKLGIRSLPTNGKAELRMRPQNEPFFDLFTSQRSKESGFATKTKRRRVAALQMQSDFRAGSLGESRERILAKLLGIASLRACFHEVANFGEQFFLCGQFGRSGGLLGFFLLHLIHELHDHEHTCGHN